MTTNLNINFSAKDYANAALETAKEVGVAVKNAVINGTNKAVTVVKAAPEAISTGVNNALDVSKQDKAFAQARAKVDSFVGELADKTRAALDTAEDKLTHEGYQAVVLSEVNVKPLTDALENAKLSVNEEDSKVKAFMKEGVNKLLSYHQVTAEKGEAATRKIANGAYAITKLITAPLNFFRAGRVVQEALSLGVAAIARAVATVGALIVFALPEILAVGALATAATFAGVGIAAGGSAAAATISALKISGYVLAGLAAAGYIGRNEIMHSQAKKRDEQISDKQDKMLELLGAQEADRSERANAAAAKDTRYWFNPSRLYS